MIVRSIVHFFYLREYVASSVIAVRVHSSFEVEIGSTFVFILDSFLVVDHFAELFLPPLVVLFILPVHPFTLIALNAHSHCSKVKLITDKPNSQREGE